MKKQIRFFLCFDREIDKQHASKRENWTLNSDSNLIEEVTPWEAGSWMIVKVALEVKEKFNGETDYWLNYDTGQGVCKYLLIPKEEEKQGPYGGPDGGKCAEVIYFGDSKDKHYSKEGEDHAVTFQVRKFDPDCDLDVEWGMNKLDAYLHQQSRDAPLSQERDDYTEVHYSYPLGYFSTGSGRQTYKFHYEAKTDIQITYKHGDEIIWGPQSWAFPPDLETPIYTREPQIMTGLQAADFLEDHYWEMRQEPPGQLPDDINYMLFILRTCYPCAILCLWFAKDTHTFWHTLIVDYGTNENQIPGPDNEITMNEADILGAFVVDIDREYYEEYCEWRDRPGRLAEDAHPEGEYKVWVFEIENFIKDNPDVTIIKPVVVDMAGNWKRGPNIYPLVQECGCSDLTVNFSKPDPGIIKQFINLSSEMNLPPNDAALIERRGQRIDVEVLINRTQAGQNKIIKPGTRLVLGWDDPPIDNIPFTTINNPNSGNRPHFPWLSDNRRPCDPQYYGSLCDEVVPWDNNPQARFPEPWQGPSPILFPNYPHLDNSFPGDYATTGGFEGIPSAYSRAFNYQRPGFGIIRNYSLVADISTEYYFENCTLKVMTDFWTSNFGGDNYTLTAQVQIPTGTPGQYVSCNKVNHNGIINVWRKAYLEESVMENASGVFLGTYRGTQYTHYNGPFVSHGELQYIKNAFDDCFIEVREGYGRELNTHYQRIIDDYYLDNYAHNYTYFHQRATPVAAQLLYVDHLDYVPFDSILLGLTAAPNSERNHTGNAYGSIYDVFGNQLDWRGIDHIPTQDVNPISNNTAAHEIGHSLGFYSSDEKNTGHRSGPGIMWSYLAPTPSTENRMSYIWGDHVFVLRLSPAVIDN